MADLQGISSALIAGKKDDVEAKVRQALADRTPVKAILEQGLIAGMAVVGQRFRSNEIYVPEVLIAARAMKAGMALLEPHLAGAGIKPVGKVVLGTVKGDLHDIGKNLVSMMLQGGGYQVIDLGTDVSAEAFVSAAKTHGAKLIGMSALLTTTMPNMKQVVQAAKASGLDGLRTMVGGAPLTQQFADEIGADGYAPDAASAVDIAQRLIGARN